MADNQCTTLVLATGNPHKARELMSLLARLGIPLQTLAGFSDPPSIAENGATVAENARRKAAGYARQLHACVLADDTALEVDALRGAPGVRSARYAGEGATMAENRGKLLAELDRAGKGPRTARFVCHLAVADPQGTIVAEATGECRGRIRHEPAGTAGFGYDALFEIVEYHRTLAEFGPVVTAAIGHRGRAVRALLANWRTPTARV